MKAPLQPRWLTIAHAADYTAPIPAMKLWPELADVGASLHDIAKAVRLLGVVPREGLIGHEGDFGLEAAA